MSTLTELRLEVAEEIGSINVTDDVTKIDRELNRAVRKILRVPPYVFMTSQTVTPGANADYSLASTVLVIAEAYFTAASIQYPPLERKSLQEILDLRRASTSASFPARYFALVGSNKLAFWPTPSAADTLTMYYVPAPTVMSSGTHDPSDTTYGGIPVDYHDLIARYAMARMASFDDDSSSAQGSRYWQEFRDGLTDMRRDINRKPGRRLARATLSRRVPLPADPSIPVRY